MDVDLVRFSGFTNSNISKVKEKDMNPKYVEIYKKENGTIRERMYSICKSLGIEYELTKPRKNKILVGGIVFTTSRSHFAKYFKFYRTGEIPGLLRQFFLDCYDFVLSEFGFRGTDKNILSAIVYYDEDTPHLQVYYIPIADNPVRISNTAVWRKDVYHRYSYSIMLDKFYEKVAFKYDFQRKKVGLNPFESIKLDNMIKEKEENVKRLKKEIFGEIDYPRLSNERYKEISLSISFSEDGKAQFENVTEQEFLSWRQMYLESHINKAKLDLLDKKIKEIERLEKENESLDKEFELFNDVLADNPELADMFKQAEDEYYKDEIKSRQIVGKSN